MKFQTRIVVLTAYLRSRSKKDIALKTEIRNLKCGYIHIHIPYVRIRRNVFNLFEHFIQRRVNTF